MSRRDFDPSPREAVGRVDRLSAAKEIGVGASYFATAPKNPPPPTPPHHSLTLAGGVESKPWIILT
jgi:hypothetical protein